MSLLLTRSNGHWLDCNEPIKEYIMSRPIKLGSTNQSVVIKIIDSTSGLPEEAVEHNSAGIALWYRREGGTKQTITPVALAALDDAHSDGGIEHIDDGYYRLDVPDAAFDSGATGVIIGGTVTGMIILAVYVPLVAYDPADTVRLGLTALPNAAADAAGGLPISDAGGLDMDSVKTDTAAILVDTAEIGAAGAGLTAIPWNAAWDAEVQSEVDDALNTAIAELSQGVPSATPSIRNAVMLLYMALRNKLDVETSGSPDVIQIHNDAGTVISKKQLTDSGGDYSEAKMESGP